MYYWNGSAIAQTFDAVRSTIDGPIRYAVIGLGTGTLACRAERRDLQFAARASARIDGSDRAQSRQRMLVLRAALRLPYDRTVPRESVARERVDYRAFGAGPAARLVDILDAHQPLAAGGASVAIARQRGDQ